MRGLVCSRRHSQESILSDRNIFTSNISSGSITSVEGIHFFLPPRPKLASHNISFHLNHFFWPNFSSPCVPHLTRTDKFPEKKKLLQSRSRFDRTVREVDDLRDGVGHELVLLGGGGGKISGLYGSAPGNEPVDDSMWMDSQQGIRFLISAIPTILFPRHSLSHEEYYSP